MLNDLPDGTIEGPWSRKQWLLNRRTGIGGSDIGALLGLSSFTSELEVYYSKVEDTPERVPSEEMEMGRDIESFILEQWDRRTSDGFVVWPMADPELYTIRSKTFRFLLHSPDALVCTQDMTQVVSGVEVKNPRSDAAWTGESTQGLPPFYYAQVQHGLFCSGLGRWDVVALVGGQKIIVRVVYPDPEMFAQITLAADRFWNDYVLAGVPPDPDGSDSAARVLRDRWQASVDDSVEIEGSLWTWYQHAADAAAKWEAKKAKAAQMIQAEMHDHGTATVDGEKVATWKVGTRTAVDVKRLKAEQPEMAKKYSNTTHTRTFRPSAGS